MPKKNQHNEKISLTIILVITIIISILLWNFSYTKEYKGEYKLNAKIFNYTNNSPSVQGEYLNTNIASKNSYKISKTRYYAPNLTINSKYINRRSLLPNINNVEMVSKITLYNQNNTSIGHRTGNGERIANIELNYKVYNSAYQSNENNKQNNYNSTSNSGKASQMLSPTPNSPQIKIGNKYNNRMISIESRNLDYSQTIYGTELSSIQRISFPPPPINEEDIVVGDEAPLKDDFTILLLLASCFVYIKYLTSKFSKKKL